MESNTTPLVLHGPKGCGKSALVAKAFQAIKTWQPEAYKIIRFTGLTPASGTMEQLLLSIVSQCSVLAGGEDWHCPHVSLTFRVTISLKITLFRMFLHMPRFCQR